MLCNFDLGIFLECFTIAGFYLICSVEVDPNASCWSIFDSCAWRSVNWGVEAQEEAKQGGETLLPLQPVSGGSKKVLFLDGCPIGGYLYPKYTKDTLGVCGHKIQD